MDVSSIIALIFMILMIMAHIIKSIRESAELARQQQRQQQQSVDDDDDDLVLMLHPKPSKPPKAAAKQRSSVRQPLGEPLRRSDPPPAKRQALTKRLAPQGEGERFAADPGTLDTAQIVAPTVDPTVKPELESITGIYEEGAQFNDWSKSAITLDIADYFTKPGGVIHAVILAEILNPPPCLKPAR